MGHQLDPEVRTSQPVQQEIRAAGPTSKFRLFKNEAINNINNWLIA